LPLGAIAFFPNENERTLTQTVSARPLPDDLMLKTARSLVKKAVDGLMRTHNIDRSTAEDWIKEAAG